MKKHLMTMTLAAALILAGGTAMAQPGMAGGGMGGNGMEGPEGGMALQRIMPMLHHIDLTDDQREQIRDIMDEARESMDALRESELHQGMRDQFIDLFTSSTISVTEVEALLDQRLQSMEEVNSIMAEAIVAIHGVLTEEQLRAIADFEPCGAEMHAGRPGEHAPMMPGGSGMGIHPPR